MRFVRPFGPLRWRARPQHAVILLSAMLIVAYGTSTFLSLKRSYRLSLCNAAVNLQRMARSVEIGTTRSFRGIDATLMAAERTLATIFPNAPLDDPSIARLLRRFDEQAITVRRILILDGHGRVVNSTDRHDLIGENDSDKPFFAAARRGSAPMPFIGLPQRSGSGWSIMVSRPLLRGGVPVGVIAGEVPIATFTQFFEAIAATSQAHVALLRADGRLIASAPPLPKAIGREPGFAPALLGVAAHANSGMVRAAADETGEGVLRAFRRLPGQPLLISVSRDRGEILRGWSQEYAASATAFGLFALTAVVLTWIVVRTLRRQQFAALSRERSERRLNRERALLQSTLESMGEGLSVYDRHGRLMAWNRRYQQMLELPAHLSVGTSLRSLLMLQARRGDFGPVEAEAEVAMRLARFYRDLPATFERSTPGGRILQIRRRAMPDGAVLTVHSEVTELKAYERKLIETRGQAELANRAKTDFLANMSHELRTPLNAVIGFSEMICHEIFGPIKNKKYVEYLQDIHASSLHLLSIINDVLDMSKIEAGRLELSQEMLSARRVVNDAIRMLYERARARNIELIAELPVEDIVLWADERAMKQVFINLLSNAVKFSHDGGTVVVRASMATPGAVVFEVEDHGIGMNEDEVERALQPFSQAQSATTRRYGGTGLGLPISKGLVAEHGGTLTIHSREGRGTTITIVIPVEQVGHYPTVKSSPATADGG